MHPPSQETTTEGSQTPRRIQIEFRGEELVGIFFMDINQLTVLRAQRLHHSLINFLKGFMEVNTFFQFPVDHLTRTHLQEQMNETIVTRELRK